MPMCHTAGQHLQSAWPAMTPPGLTGWRPHQPALGIDTVHTADVGTAPSLPSTVWARMHTAGTSAAGALPCCTSFPVLASPHLCPPPTCLYRLPACPPAYLLHHLIPPPAGVVSLRSSSAASAAVSASGGGGDDRVGGSGGGGGGGGGGSSSGKGEWQGRR